MNDPIEVSLKYRDERNGFVSLAVDPIDNANYVWQRCKFRTAIWEEIGVTSSNIKTEPINPNTNNGDRYRCIIYVDGIVTHYSNSFLVSIDKFYSASNNKQSSRQSHSDNQSYKKKQPSVSDTDGMDGIAFERYCSNVLTNNGFSKVRVTQGSNDYGIDILAEKDSISYAIQCKCYAEKVGNKAIQEAFSGRSFYGCMVAAVLTNSYFTDSAKETAKRNSVLLWDRDYLDQMIRNPGSSQRQNKTYENKGKSENTNQQKTNHSSKASDAMPDFFKGCSNYDQVKERYRSLIKTYHPDSASGDEEYTKIIISQYEALKNKYGK